MPINRWLDKETMVHVYMDYYSAIKKSEILLFAMTWMDLEVIMLSEISQTKINTIWFDLYAVSKEHKEQSNQKQTHKYSGQFGDGEKEGGWEGWEDGMERVKEVQISSWSLVTGMGSMAEGM